MLVSLNTSQQQYTYLNSAGLISGFQCQGFQGSPFPSSLNGAWTAAAGEVLKKGCLGIY
jgi:hypothetical protein